MNPFDLSILHYLNGFAHRWAYIDRSLACLESNDLFKGGVILTLLWWLWFRPNEDERTREYIVSTTLASLVVILVARLLAMLLPFRVRPIHNAALHFVAPYGLHPEVLDGWSAFPSDHAAFFFALATGILLVSRKVGGLALLYTFLVICLPRIYFGLHYPTDIIVGAILGVAAPSIAGSDRLRKKLSSRVLQWECERPELFYPVSFLLTVQMMVLFYSVRDLGHRLYSLF